MGRTACTEPQCLHKGALYLYFSFNEANGVCSDNLGFSRATVCTLSQGVADWEWCQE